MITFYKEYMIQYNERPVQDSYSKQNERPKQIVVTSIVANGNFHCMYGERIYDSLEDVKHDIDEGRYEGMVVQTHFHAKYKRSTTTYSGKLTTSVTRICCLV